MKYNWALQRIIEVLYLDMWFEEQYNIYLIGDEYADLFSDRLNNFIISKVEPLYRPAYIPYRSLPSHRERRGKIVEIPKEWRGKTTHPQTIRKRQSKMTKKLRKKLQYGPGISDARRRLKLGEHLDKEIWE